MAKKNAAPTKSEILAQIAKDRPDAVLLDVRMPGMDGPRAARALRARTRTPEVSRSRRWTR